MKSEYCICYLADLLFFFIIFFFLRQHYRRTSHSELEIKDPPMMTAVAELAERDAQGWISFTMFSFDTMPIFQTLPRGTMLFGFFLIPHISETNLKNKIG